MDKEITFDDHVIEKIAGKTAQEIDGVLELMGGLIDSVSSRFTGDKPEQGVSVDLDSDQQAVEIELEGTLEYGKDANEIFDKISRKVTAAVQSMTGYKVTSIKLHVKDLLTANEWRDQQSDGDKGKKTNK